MRTIRRIYLHTSDSRFGDVSTIDEWHRARGWNSIGYHFVILNGRRRSKKDEKGARTYPYVQADDGLVEVGRPLQVAGAHVQKDNAETIGICLIGADGLYTVAQVAAALCLVRELLAEHGLTWEDVHGHYEAPTAKAQGKTCPDFRIEDFRALAER